MPLHCGSSSLQFPGACTAEWRAGPALSTFVAISKIFDESHMAMTLSNARCRVLNSLSEKYNMRSVGVSSYRGLAAALLGTTFAASGIAAEEGTSSGVLEVVVTAQRRSENLQP